MRMVVARDLAAVDLQHQGLELVTQVAHGADARHSSPAFERVQLTLQLGDRLFVLAIFIPTSQRALSGFQQLGRFLAVDVRYLVIEFFRRRPFVLWGRLDGRGRCNGRGCGNGCGYSNGRRRRGLCQRGHHGRGAGIARGVGDHAVHFGFEISKSRQQLRLIGEKPGCFIDVGEHILNGAHRLLERGQARIRQAMSAVEDFAHDMVQRFGDANAMACLRHLRTAAQGVDGPVHRFGQIVRCGLT